MTGHCCLVSPDIAVDDVNCAYMNVQILAIVVGLYYALAAGRTLRCRKQFRLCLQCLKGQVGLLGGGAHGRTLGHNTASLSVVS